MLPLDYCCCNAMLMLTPLGAAHTLPPSHRACAMGSEAPGSIAVLLTKIALHTVCLQVTLHE